MRQEYLVEKYTCKIKSLFAHLQDALLARKGVVAYIPIIVVTICMFCGTSWLIFWSAADPARYQCYALTFWLGSNATNLLPVAQCQFLNISAAQPPFHMLPIEYPPLTLLPFSLALLVPLAYYQWAFALLMSFVSVLIYWLLLRYGPRGAALMFAVYMFIGALALAQVRFDLIPAALTLLCVIAAERKHWTSAYVALAFGVLLKIYPILLLPALFMAEQQAGGKLHMPAKPLTLKWVPYHFWYTLKGAGRWNWKNCLIFLGIVLGVTGVFALLNFQEAVASQFSYFMQRPIQIESTGNTLLWLATHVGIPLKIVYSYGSLNSISPLSAAVSLVGTLCFGLGCLYVFWQQWCRRFDITQAAIALLFVFVATGKVFSPQYLIWLMPLLVYAGAFDVFWLLFWGAISLLTTFIYIFMYSHVLRPELIQSVPGFFETASVRNMFFVFVTLAYLFNWFQSRRRRRLPSLPMLRETP
ncbi:MAG: DUF2029 domain-containing protein [Chloroflexi bacterium]|nr:DUF2029 domain-containing protein [Chloroflexota bacterium]